MIKKEWWDSLDDLEKQAFKDLNDIFGIEFMGAHENNKPAQD